MKKFSSFFLVVGCVLLLSLLVGVSCRAQSVKTEDIQKQLNKIFPNFKIAEVNPTPIKGIYEVVGAESGTILYYSPEDKGYLFFGEIWDTSGKSLTAERREEIQQKRIAQMLKDLPLDIAVKVGSGPKTVIEISDPTCPFCRNAYEELKNHKDVTKYVFFLPTHGEHSIKQISEILCSKDMVKALDDAYTGK
ncbi:MAG: DsbC family protein, partial [Dictyoglomus turgidum]